MHKLTDLKNVELFSKPIIIKHKIKGEISLLGFCNNTHAIIDCKTHVHLAEIRYTKYDAPYFKYYGYRTHIDDLYVDNT